MPIETIASNATIDLIVHASYKYGLIAKESRTLVGQHLRMVNLQAVNETQPDAPRINRRAFIYPEFRPFERKVLRLAISGAIACYEDMCCVGDDFAESAAYRLVAEVGDRNAVAYGYTDGGAPARLVMRSELRTSPLITGPLRFWNITEEQRDPETEEGSVMVRPNWVIRAEREQERQRIMSERFTDDADDDDADDDDWRDVDELD